MVPVTLIVHFISLRRIKRKAVLFANFEAMEKVYGQKIISRNYPLLLLRMVLLVAIVMAASGIGVMYDDYASAFDYAIVIDASGSMMAEDYYPNRLEAAKNASLWFIDELPERSSVTVISFAGAAFIDQELTSRKDRAAKAIREIDVVLTGGTAIGEAIISGTNAVINGENDQSVILMTDGKNNVGPTIEDALEYSRKHGVIINTIGIGTPSGTIGDTSMSLGIDSASLEMIANQTGGSFFLSKDRDGMRAAFSYIIRETKREFTFDLAQYFLLAAFVLFAVEMILVNSKYRTIP